MSKIAYLTMSYDIAKTRSVAIPNCVDQIGRDSEKVLYLMYQEPFPPHIESKHDFDIKIREFNVEGIEGYGWWLMKLKRFLEVCDEEYFIWWDEDDYREASYSLKAMAAIHGGIVDTFGETRPPSALAWNLWNYEVKLGSILKVKYNSGMGTLAGRVDALRKPVARLLKQWPDGRLRMDDQRNVVYADYNGTWNYGAGALDNYLKRLLNNKHKVAEHEGVRFMTYHSKTNTRGGRKPEENVDYV